MKKAVASLAALQHLQSARFCFFLNRRKNNFWIFILLNSVQSGTSSASSSSFLRDKYTFFPCRAQGGKLLNKIIKFSIINTCYNF